MKQFTSLPVWQQYALSAALMLPWLALSLVTADLLPESWRFQSWPEDIRNLSAGAFLLFVIADALFSVWYLFLRPNEDTKSSGSLQRAAGTLPNRSR